MSTLLFISSCDKNIQDDCTKHIWNQDFDGDGLGNPNEIFKSCIIPNGYVSNFDDTDDLCDGMVDICGVCNGSGKLIWYQDADGDGLGNPNISQNACKQPIGYVKDHSDTHDSMDSKQIVIN